MDILDLNPDSLDTTAAIIEGYCERQKGIMDDYLNDMVALSGEWTDDVTMGPLIEEVRRLKAAIVGTMDEIRATYPQYFRSKADHIRHRPKI